MNAPGPLTLLDDPVDIGAASESVRGHSIVAHDPAIQLAHSPIALMMQAQQNGTSLETLERMWALQVQFEQHEARKAFVRDVTAFKAEPLVIFKKKSVGYTTTAGEFVGYKHAELSDITDVVCPALARHNLSHHWDVKQENGRIHVSCVLTHVLGHTERVSMDAAPDVSGKKNAIQSIASATSYLERYTLLAVTGMSTKGMDDDGAGSGDAGDEDDDDRGAPRAPAPPPPAPEEYPQARFDANLPNWREVIQSGRKTSDDLIAMVESKGTPLTSAQKAKLRGIRKA